MLDIIQSNNFDTSASSTLSSDRLAFRRGFEDNNLSNMPADYTSYLLSASPPGFDLQYLMVRNINSLNKVQLSSNPQQKSESLPELNKIGFPDPDSDCSCGELRKFPSCDQINPSGENTTSGFHCKPLKQAKGMGKKKVSFADDIGLRLVQIKWMTEPSDTPPRLRPDLLSCLTQGATAGVVETPPLKLNFSQPASNYMAFRAKIESNFVSLENVILKDYNLLGTIKVKNIAFEKRVFVRCTFDTWATQTDIPAVYVGQTSQVDTFSFDINVPTNMDSRRKMQFCICYQANGGEFWDSNNGSNYEVISADWKSLDVDTCSYNTTDRDVYDLNSKPQWTEFSGWTNMDAACPYY